MITIKKLIFALPFLFCLAAFYRQTNQAFINIYLSLDISTAAMITLALLIGFLLLTGVFFVIFATLASDWKLILPVSILGTLSALFFIPLNLSIILMVGSLLTFIISNFSLQKNLSSYLTFQTKLLFIPSIHQIILLLTLSTSLVFYLSANTKIHQEGFKLPESLTEFVSQIVSSQMPAELDSSQVNLSPEQTVLLKQNPQLLQQYGLDPNMLNSIEKPSLQKVAIKVEMQKQIQNLLDPYTNFVPAILAMLFFLTLYSITSLLTFLLNPLLWAIFLILEKTGFTKYQIEMRKVEKLIV